MIRFHHHLSPKPSSNFFSIYTFTLSLIFLADATLAYIFPILVEKEVQSQVILGIIMSFSSVVGIMCDFFFPQFLRKFRWASILLLGSIFSIGFTFFIHFSVYTLPIIFALLAVSFWGIYYELIIFSEERFMLEETKPKFYTRNWSIISSIIFFSWIVAPILAAKLLLQNQNNITFTILIIQIITVLCASFLFFRSVKKDTKEKAHKIVRPMSLLKTIKEWKKFLPYLSGIVVIIFSIRLLESAYWMFGALFAETLGDVSKGEEFLILLVYTIPLALGSLFGAYLNITENKKILTYILTLISGLLTFYGVYFSETFFQMAPILFIANIIFAIVLGLVSSQSSDFQNKLDTSERFFAVGLISFSGSLAYIIGPLILGYVSEVFGYKTSFALLGLLISLFSFCLIFNYFARFKFTKNVI